MITRKFRLMFHTVEPGTLLTGSAWKVQQESIYNFAYVGGFVKNLPDSNEKELKELAIQLASEKIEYEGFGHLDVLILADYDVPQVKRFMELLRAVPVTTVIYPLIPPESRQKVIEKIEALKNLEDEEITHDKNSRVSYDEIIQFLKHPYHYLRKRRTPIIYPIYGNGGKYMGEENNQDALELVDREELIQIRRTEGYEIPAVRAGFLLKDKWLFYLGMYGEGLVVYTAPINHGPLADDCMLQIKNTDPYDECSPLACATVGRCSAYCMFKNDWDIYKMHNRKEAQQHVNGTLLLGSANLNTYGSQIVQRFASVLFGTRVFMVPNDGELKDWNEVLVGMESGGHRRCWVGSSRAASSVIKSVVCADANHRYLIQDKKSGVCIMGLITPIDASM